MSLPYAQLSSAPRVQIIMPCTRPWFLPLITYNLAQMEPHGLEIRLHLGFQGTNPTEKDPWGMAKSAEICDGLNVGWVCFWSDDSIHDLSLFRKLEGMIKANPGAGAIVFGQKHIGGGGYRAIPQHMKPFHVCGSQVFFERNFLGDERMDRPKYREVADGFLIQKMHQKAPEKFVYCDEPLIYYNSLTPPPWPPPGTATPLPPRMPATHLASATSWQTRP